MKKSFLLLFVVLVSIGASAQWSLVGRDYLKKGETVSYSISGPTNLILGGGRFYTDWIVQNNNLYILPINSPYKVSVRAEKAGTCTLKISFQGMVPQGAGNPMLITGITLTKEITIEEPGPGYGSNEGGPSGGLWKPTLPTLPGLVGPVIKQ